MTPYSIKLSRCDTFKFDRAVNTQRRESAAGNVFTADVKIQKEDEFSLIEAINKNLPSDICVYSFARVEQNFCARNFPKILTYRYFLFDGDLDIDMMQRTAPVFIGKHLASSFTSLKYKKLQDQTMYEIFSSRIVVLQQDSSFNPVGYFEVKSSCFGENQVK